MNSFTKFNQLAPDETIPWYMRSVGPPLNIYIPSARTKNEFLRNYRNSLRLYAVFISVVSILVVIAVNIGVLVLLYKILTGSDPALLLYMAVAFIVNLQVYFVLPMHIFVFKSLNQPTVGTE